MTDRRAGLMAVTALAMAALCALSVPSLARVYKGSGKANKVTGTKKGDRISLRGGNDRARGRGGNDRISGGRGKDRLRGDSGKDRLSGNGGNDRLHGGKGRDRLNGGTGNDVLNAVDGKRDASVNGGKGRNTCRVDNADLKVVKRCSELIVAKPGRRPGWRGWQGRRERHGRRSPRRQHGRPAAGGDRGRGPHVRQLPAHLPLLALRRRRGHHAGPGERRGRR